jgi:murein DD-endopeptidase MepM/ murein hydrolase activator NlpD
MRRGVSLFAMVLLVAAVAAAAARADAGSDTTTTGTTDTTTTATTTTTTSTTTTTPATTTTAPSYVPLVPTHLPRGCVGAGVAAIASGGDAVVTLGPRHGGLGASEYPASRPFLTFDSATVTGSGCRTARATLTNVSLFAGAVTAATVTARDGKGTVTGLEVGGSPVTAKPGQTVGVGSWGLLELGAGKGRLTAPLALRLVYRHNSVPAGTTIYLGFAARRQPPPRPAVKPVVPHHKPRHHAKGPHFPQPLEWTPHLGFEPSHYVFPVDSGASYGDTYGANRNDIYDGWHHGDDLFAPLGTPVVAVATGKLSPLGWDGLGGWRLWLTDKKGNSFYYAHLAGYSRLILHDRHVKAGEVIGFLGRTGDAFTTTPHLHFEIHPHQRRLVRLGYDGAVDPTTYLHTWRVLHLRANAIPPAARLRAPAGTPSQEAAVVWGELLKARHLMPDGQPAVAPTPSLRRPFPATRETPAFVDARRLASSRVASDAQPNSPWPTVALGLALAAIAATASFTALRRRRSS